MATIRDEFLRVHQHSDAAGSAPEPGPMDRRWTYGKVLDIPLHWKSCVTRTVNVLPFDSPLDPAAANVAPALELNIPTYWSYYLFASLNTRLSGVNNATDRNAIVLAELMGMNLPPIYCLNEASAKNRLLLCLINRIQDVRIGHVVIPRAEEWSALTAQGYGQIDNTVAFTGRNLTRHSLPEEFPNTAAAIEALTDPQRGQLFYLLASFPGEHAGDEEVKNSLRNHLVSILVGVVKKGCVSAEFVAKIRTGMIADFGTIVTIDSATLSRWYSRYGGGITDVNIKNIIRRWLALIPEEGLRLILTLSQAAGTGLTHYMTIAKAMRKFPNFNWNLISEILPADWHQFELAVLAVGQNAWYGYKRDLGAAKASGFRNLAWVAKELLIRGMGDAGLRQYGGWTRNVPQQSRITWIICCYLREPYQREVLEEWGIYERPEDSEIPRNIAVFINDPNGIYN